MQAYANGSPRQVHEWGYPTTHMTAPLANNLVHYDPASPDPNEVVCDLCTSWEQSEDGKSFIFHIHPQANWWDGMPVTAADIEFNFQSMVDPDQFEILTGRVTSSTVQIGNYFESARVIDEKTVEINLKFPSGAFLPALAIDTCMMQPKHTVLDEGKLQTFAEPDDYNLSGPFMPEKVQRDVLTEYVKNPNYFKEGKPYIDGMTHFIIVGLGHRYSRLQDRRDIDDQRRSHQPHRQASGAAWARPGWQVHGALCRPGRFHGCDNQHQAEAFR